MLTAHSARSMAQSNPIPSRLRALIRSVQKVIGSVRQTAVPAHSNTTHDTKVSVYDSGFPPGHGLWEGIRLQLQSGFAECGDGPVQVYLPH